MERGQTQTQTVFYVLAQMLGSILFREVRCYVARFGAARRAWCLHNLTKKKLTYNDLAQALATVFAPEPD